jgi:hypothetical protein
VSDQPAAPVVKDFPENFVEVLKDTLTAIDISDHILGRPLKPTDPSGSIGVFAVDWTPVDAQIGQYDPAVTRYMLSIQSFVKHGSEQEGVALHARLAKKVRVMLYRNEDLRVRLSSLSVVEDGVTERVQRWGVEIQRYLSNEIDNNFMFLASTECFIETEMV